VKHIVIALAAVTGALVSSAPASAQVYAVTDILPPQEITAIVRQAGLQPISRPVWRPGRYVLHAVDRYGRTLRVAVDARMGEIIRAIPVDVYADVDGYIRPPRDIYGRDPYPPVARAPVPPANVPYEGEYDDSDVPPPDASPRVIPGPRSAAPAPSRSAALAPKPEVKKTTPLPRARPAETTASIPSPAKPAEPEKPASTPSSPGPEATSSAAPNASEPKKEIRMIDMSKPKTAETSEAKTAATETKTAPAETSEAKPSAPDVKPLEDKSAKPRF